MVNVPSFIVRSDSEKNIDFHPASPFGGGRPGRTKRRHLKKGKKVIYIFKIIIEH